MKHKHPFKPGRVRNAYLPKPPSVLNHDGSQCEPYEIPGKLEKASGFTKVLKSGENAAYTRGHLWQRRFREHLIRDETGYRQHVDYIYWNPVKQGWERCVKEWPHSIFHRFVALGFCHVNWVLSKNFDIQAKEYFEW